MSFSTPRRNSLSNLLGSHHTHHDDIKSKQFANGDSYSGAWRNSHPEGEGKYTWKDGSWYEGSWKDGMKHGCGKCVWPSGASYQGEWKDGAMHGVGTLEAPNGARYQGGWQGDAKHGLGRQLYSSGDVYEGLWRRGRQEGPGRYIFAGGDEYDGEWLGGQFSGHGTFVWRSGERYDGLWKGGRQEGMGVLTLPDGSVYDAQWRKGRRHGWCLYRPGGGATDLQTASSADTYSLMTSSIAHIARDSVGSASPVSGAGGPSPLSPPQPHGSGRDDGAGHAAGAGAFIRVYRKGRVTQEWAMARDDADAIMAALGRGRPDGAIGRLLRKGTAVPGGSGDKGGGKLGEAVYKGHWSYELMLDLQLGIRYSVSRITPEPSPKELAPPHFELKVKQYFPREGSEMTPVHSSEPFLWKDYAPMVFRKLREMFGVEAGGYMRSLCSDAALRQLNSPGKSGACFFLSHDDRFFVKTLKKGEQALLFSSLPAYHKHMASHPHSLLTKFFGLHRVTTPGGKKVHFVVMGNLFNTVVQLHKKFDLKGSRLGRTVGPGGTDNPHAILKDLDLDMSFRLADGWLDRLMYQLKADCGLLESCAIMDYSLLLGVHFCRRAAAGAKGSPGAGDAGEVAGGPQERERASSLDQPLSPYPRGQPAISTDAAPSPVGVSPFADSALGPPSPSKPGAYTADITAVGDGDRAPAVGNARNFDVFSNKEELVKQLAAVEARMRALAYSEQRIQDILGLAELKILGDKLKKGRKGGAGGKSCTEGVIKALAQARQGAEGGAGTRPPTSGQHPAAGTLASPFATTQSRGTPVGSGARAGAGIALGSSPTRSLQDGELPYYSNPLNPSGVASGVRYPGRMLGLEEGKGGRGGDGDDDRDDRDSAGDSEGADSGGEAQSTGPGGAYFGAAGSHSGVGGNQAPAMYYGSSAAKVHLGLGMPAVAVHHPPAIATEVGRRQAGSRKLGQLVAAGKVGKSASAPDGGSEGEEQEEVVLYFGIIDILQDFSLRKVVERGWKSIIHDGYAISVAPPALYAARFTDFMTRQVFPEPLSDAQVPAQAWAAVATASMAAMQRNMSLNASSQISHAAAHAASQNIAGHSVTSHYGHITPHLTETIPENDNTEDGEEEEE